ncbi:MAG: transporter substrate-binding domain-containing protein [Gammaproteobacteria bacterium]|nr:transporter substrate-binding domain-containing protein [Gammaproteobacteria bacterium]
MPAKTIAKRRALRWALLCTLLLRAAIGGAAHAQVLDDIQARGTLRVATSLDYRPFSYRMAGRRVGIDIELARALASTLGVRVEWVAFTWAELETLLTQGAFDIAMSGVSITPERMQIGFFSNPYFETGKALLTRCDTTRELRSLADVDRPDVKIIVNPGGSNQRFVAANIHSAHVQVHTDNLSIFDALATGAADVMITDAIEAQIEAAADDRLCAPVLTSFLEPILKAWFIPRDDEWQRTVNEALATLERSGALAAAVNQYVPAEPNSYAPAGSHQ